MSSEFGWEGRTHSLDVRVSPSRDDLVARPAFAYLNPDIADSCVVAHIRALALRLRLIWISTYSPPLRGDNAAQIQLS